MIEDDLNPKEEEREFKPGKIVRAKDFQAWSPYKLPDKPPEQNTLTVLEGIHHELISSNEILRELLRVYTNSLL